MLEHIRKSEEDLGQCSGWEEFEGPLRIPSILNPEEANMSMNGAPDNELQLH